jgi:hypothetical protein
MSNSEARIRAAWLGRKVVADMRDRPIRRKVPGAVVDVTFGDRGGVYLAIRPALAQDCGFDCVFHWIAVAKVKAA